MARKTVDELAESLAQAAKQVDIGTRYMHYKELYYTVESLVILEETNEVAVMYRPEYDKRLVFVRPLSAWLESVKWQGEIVPRFVKVDP